MEAPKNTPFTKAGDAMPASAEAAGSGSEHGPDPRLDSSRGRARLSGFLRLELLLPLLLIAIALYAWQWLRSDPPRLGGLEISQTPTFDPGHSWLVDIEDLEISTEGSSAPELFEIPEIGTLFGEAAELYPHLGDPSLGAPNPFPLPRLGDVLSARYQDRPIFLGHVRSEGVVVVDGEVSDFLDRLAASVAAAQHGPPTQQGPPPARDSPDGKTGIVGGSPVGLLSSSPAILTAATIHALIRAERAGVRHLQTHLLAGPDTVGQAGLASDQTFQAMAEGIRRAAPSLRHLRTIEFVLPLEQYIDMDVFDAALPVDRAATALLPITTPLRWPGGSTFALPVVGEPGALPTLAATWDLEAPITYQPFLFYLSILLATWLGLARAFPSPTTSLYRGTLDRFEPVGRGKLLLLSTSLWLVLIGLFSTANGLFLGRSWIVFPDSILATASGTTFLASAIAVVVALGLVTLVRRGAEKEATARPQDLQRDNLVRTLLVRETPVRSIEDNRLGFGPLVEAFRRFLDNAQTEPPVIVGINGPWGSGKSSLMSMVSSELDKSGRFHTVWFNAWRYQKEEQAMAAFLQALARQLSADWGMWKGLRIAWMRFRSLGFWGMLALLSPIAALIIAERSGLQSQTVIDFVEGLGEKHPLGALLAFLVAGGASIKGLPWLASYFKPFRLHFSKLFETKDYSGRIGFLDEFTREFGFYRRVVGNKKLLVVVDDLDRCSPDHVVDVLKAINQIVTSDAGAGKTFFLLGFDRAYVHKAVAVHFSRFAKDDPNFAEQYLKKMITLSVAVPRAGESEILNLMEGLDEAGVDSPAEPTPADAANPSLLDRLTLSLRNIPRWIFELGAAIAVLALSVGVVPQQDSEVSNPVVTSPAVTETESSPGGLSLFPELRGVVSTAKAEAVAPEITPWWAYTPALVLAGLALLFVLRQRPVKTELRYRREEEDSFEFLSALERYSFFLPRNPRDAIRLVNRLRMGYLVQSLMGGEELDEREHIFLGLFFDRYPELLGPLGNTSLSEWRHGAAMRNGRMTKIAADIQGMGIDEAALEDPSKVRRFAALYDHLIELGH